MYSPHKVDGLNNAHTEKWSSPGICSKLEATVVHDFFFSFRNLSGSCTIFGSFTEHFEKNMNWV